MLFRSALRRQLKHKAQRRITTNAVERETGHIEAGPDEALLFFDNVYPIQYGLFDIRYWLVRLDTGMANRVLRNAVPKDLGVELASMTPRVKEGGALLRVRWDKLSGLTPQAVASRIEEHLAKDQQHIYFNPLRRLRSFLVRGRPWLEDLNRFPSQRLKIEFEGGPELSQETLYEYFRKYGKIINIFPASATQKYAILQFAQIRSATAARTCLHGFKDGATILKIGFESQLKGHMIREYLLSHPRFTIPAVAALIAGISVSVFEPIRTWFVEQTISRSFHYEDTKFFKWIQSGARSLIPRKAKNTRATRGTWFERESTKKEVSSWLNEAGSTFSIVQGPRGSGKRDLVVDEVLKDRRNVFVLDCESLVESRGDSATINNLAGQLGYRPIFSWMNSISSFIDLAAQGMMGQSAGFSETLDSQVKKILGTGASAVKQIALKHGAKTDGRDEDYLEANPGERPVIVIDKFLYKQEGSELVYDNIAKWAATLVESNIAHVIFLTTDISYSKMLQKVLPDKLFRTVTLGDATPDMALEYVTKKLADQGIETHKNETVTPQIKEQLTILGGRLTDLDFLARRLALGETPQAAGDAIINQAANEVIKLYLTSTSGETWDRLQAWYLLCALTEAKELRYQEALLDPVLKNGDESLKALEQAEMISIVTRNGHPSAIRVGKPVYHAAFQRIRNDAAFCAGLDLERVTALLGVEASTIAKAEEELILLKEISVQKKVAGRIEYLLSKVETSQKNIVEMEKVAGQLKTVLRREF
ncbi:Mitochondrial escape protein 2 [Taphrina deformans PYCC 5710]|uniref:Mitochondrial escape protein 2 n=1 Tax=Taphrina deformans (strain PYCC 5710 / ATCC 11124 / CBS 356.35 / IMI 108563 / JCM 9778 / NBRC 8474) TaxID=1097556 RepID=R4XB49_TAPDE|nr:Mitochondrial escape protein 2 [Taphrina deformans PYCC 5710]|eukprot:CCG80528.1 Mitochondrial escape protein 2 [Taphrina deformans PYCC 5710]